MDALTEETILINVKKLYDVWQNSQKNPKSLHQPAIDDYIKDFQTGKYVKPITIQNYGFDDEQGLYVRTLDGRHRLAAAHAAGIEEIKVLKTSIAEQAKDMLG